MISLLFHALSGFALIQDPQATVAGTVRDVETGAPIAGAVVTLPDLGRNTIADTRGRYTLTDVPAGPQHIAVRYLGYAPRVVHALVPREGALEINIALRAAPQRLRTIEVRPGIAVRGVEDDGLDYPERSASIAAIRNHPMLAEPDGFEALGGGEVVLSPESPSGLHVRGGGTDQVGYLLDGVPVLSPYHAAGLFSAWNPDALAGLGLLSSGPSPASPDVISGTVAGVTRAPSERLHTQGSLSTTQGRFTVDGPLGATGIGYLVSIRSDFPHSLAPGDDPSYLRGETGDLLAKVESPALGGAVRLLAYDNENELDAAAVAGVEAGAAAPARNTFAWHSRSLGGEWRREWTGAVVRVLGWGASAESSAGWAAIDGPLGMTSSRREVGGLAAVELRSALAHTEVGLRMERSLTDYRIEPDSQAAQGWRLAGRTPVAAVFARQVRAIGRRLQLDAGVSLAAASGHAHADPGARLRWRLSERVTLIGSYVRRHQYAQSLRNPESVVGNVFPAELWLGSGAPGVPTGRSDLAVVAAELRPSPGVRVGGQAYARRMAGLLLAAPGAAEPFTTASFTTGSGSALGASLDASVSTARYAVLASYGFQRVRLGDDGVRYIPEYGTTHLLEGGVILFPSATSSIRLGVTGAFGRRSTTTSGGLEWESCNLLDRGCELGGSPHYAGAPLGGTRLPAYVRIDLGLRKHWHIQLGGRDAVVALFGTVTNVLGRANLLTYARDPSTGVASAVELRPLSPLVVGLDWQF